MMVGAAREAKALAVANQARWMAKDVVDKFSAEVPKVWVDVLRVERACLFWDEHSSTHADRCIREVRRVYTALSDGRDDQLLSRQVLMDAAALLGHWEDASKLGMQAEIKEHLKVARDMGKPRFGTRSEHYVKLNSLLAGFEERCYQELHSTFEEDIAKGLYNFEEQEREVAKCKREMEEF